MVVHINLLTSITETLQKNTANVAATKHSRTASGSEGAEARDEAETSRQGARKRPRPSVNILSLLHNIGHANLYQANEDGENENGQASTSKKPRVNQSEVS